MRLANSFSKQKASMRNKEDRDFKEVKKRLDNVESRVKVLEQTAKVYERKS